MKSIPERSLYIFPVWTLLSQLFLYHHLDSFCMKLSDFEDWKGILGTGKDFGDRNRTCKFDQILWPMLSSTKISCLTGVLNPGLLSVKPRLYHWAKLPLLKMRGKTVKYILHKYILGYFGNQQKATDQINSRLNKQQKTTDFKKQQISKTTDFKNSRFQKTDFKNNS